MKNRILTLLLLGAISINTIGCSTTSNTGTTESVSNNTVESVSDNTTESVSGNTVDNEFDGVTTIYQDEDCSLGIPTRNDGVDETSLDNIMLWDCITDIDIASNAITTLYYYYDCGIQDLDTSTKDGDNTIYTYNLHDGTKVNVVQYADGVWEIMDIDSGNVIWSSKVYREEHN